MADSRLTQINQAGDYAYADCTGDQLAREDASESAEVKALEEYLTEARAQGRAEMLKEVEKLRRWVQDDIDLCRQHPVQKIREEGMWLVLRELDRRWPRAQQAASEERFLTTRERKE